MAGERRADKAVVAMFSALQTLRPSDCPRLIRRRPLRSHLTPLGYTQSGPLFRSKTRAVEKLLQKSLAPFALSPILIYPTGPLRLSPADVPGFAPTPAASAEAASESAPQELDAWSWFRRDETTQRYEQFDRGIRTLAEAMRGAGGVDGVVGFSQGGALAALVAALMEKPERTLPEGGEFGFVEELRAANGGRPLKFSVIYSGFIARDETLASWLYEPPIATPTLHFLGSLDTVVEESRSQGLVDCCKDSVVVVHPGGHYVPVAKEWVMPLIGFVKKYSENA